MSHWPESSVSPTSWSTWKDKWDCHDPIKLLIRDRMDAGNGFMVIAQLQEEQLVNCSASLSFATYTQKRAG